MEGIGQDCGELGVRYLAVQLDDPGNEGQCYRIEDMSPL